jgi:Protein of unknown function (DUF3106)
VRQPNQKFSLKSAQSTSLLFVLCANVASMPAHSQTTSALPSIKSTAATRPAAEQGPKFSSLSVDEQTALKPLEKDWAGISADRKQKWRVLVARFPKMPADERARIQARMSEWAQMSPEERGKVRLQFQEASKSSPQNRQAQWQAYQALPEDQKRELATKAASTPASGAVPVPQVKSNIVPNPALAAPPRSVAPAVVQAQPGATTNLISKRVTPPVHQQTGQPKIAASPEFVDAATLLPQKGPQGAATRSAAASAPVLRP